MFDFQCCEYFLKGSVQYLEQLVGQMDGRSDKAGYRASTMIKRNKSGFPELHQFIANAILLGKSELYQINCLKDGIRKHPNIIPQGIVKKGL